MLKRATTRGRASEGKAKLLSFRYTAQAGQGKVVKGSVKAMSEVAAQNLLVEQGYTPLTLEPIASPLSLEGALPSLFGIKPAQIVSFSNQLATLLESGVSLLPALQLLEGQSSGSRAFERVLRSIAQDLGTGKSFSDAIGRHPTVFSDIYIRTISVGDRTGNLQTVLRQMAEYIEKQGAFAKKASKALAYPMMVFVVGIIVSIILLVVVLPPLAEMFTALGVDLPLPTRIMMAASNFFTSYLLYIAGGSLTVIVSFIVFIRRPKGRRMMDHFRLNAPIIGTPARLSELARICRTMVVLLGAGIPLQDVMEMLPKTTTNSVVHDTLQQVRRGLLLGQGLAYPMSALSLFPPLMLQMVRVGEESNTLESNLNVLANFYELTSEEKTDQIVAILTPMSTIAMAFFAGFVALSVTMPMYEITGAIDLG